MGEEQRDLNSGCENTPLFGDFIRPAVCLYVLPLSLAWPSLSHGVGATYTSQQCRKIRSGFLLFVVVSCLLFVSVTYLLLCVLFLLRAILFFPHVAFPVLCFLRVPFSSLFPFVLLPRIVLSIRLLHFVAHAKFTLFLPGSILFRIEEVFYAPYPPVKSIRKILSCSICKDLKE